MRANEAGVSSRNHRTSKMLGKEAVACYSNVDVEEMFHSFLSINGSGTRCWRLTFN